MKQYIGISRDHSASMMQSYLTEGACNDFNNVIKIIKSEAREKDIDTIVSVVKCGVGGRGLIERETVNSSVQRLRPLSNYIADGGSTPLFDSVGELIEILQSAPDANDDVSFLIIVITDGRDNSSVHYDAHTLSEKIRFLQNTTDGWTFVFRVPYGYKQELVRMGIPAGNIQEWEQTVEGIREASRVTLAAMSDYYGQRLKGVRSTKNFYADLSGVTRQEVKTVLTDISHEVRIWPVKRGGQQIRAFVERKLRREMALGSAFYQLTKPEKAVQDYKVIIIRDKKTGSVYSGQSARDLLGLPFSGTIKLSPGDHGNYDIYIQSTSVNRKLIAGTNVLYWPKAVLLAKAAKAVS
jgi:hypothetical protein